MGQSLTRIRHILTGLGVYYYIQFLLYLRICLEGKRQKVDFIWVIRDHKSFEWFLKLLYQFEQEQEAYLALYPNEPRFLTIHLYFTEIEGGKSVGNYLFQLITGLWSQVVGEDIFTGLKSRTHTGRPKWDELFTQFSSIDTELMLLVGNWSDRENRREVSVEEAQGFASENGMV